MKEKLKAFAAEMTMDDNGWYMERDQWNVGTGLPCHDFNREFIEPGTNEEFPEGALGIRVDDDFWLVARLPYEYRVLSIEDLVEVLWPDITDATFNPDSTD